jgi:hypothetical protein
MNENKGVKNVCIALLTQALMADIDKCDNKQGRATTLWQRPNEGPSFVQKRGTRSSP